MNYIEYIKVKDDSIIGPDGQLNAYNTNLNKDEFMTLLARMKKFNYKSFTKTYKQYIQDDIIYNNYENKEIKVYTIIPLSYETINNNNFLKISYKKSKTNIHNISPITTSYIKKFSFRVNNRIYVNFETYITDDDEYFRLYINYNHEKNVDMTIMNKEIDNILNVFV